VSWALPIVEPAHAQTALARAFLVIENGDAYLTVIRRHHVAPRHAALASREGQEVGVEPILVRQRQSMRGTLVDGGGHRCLLSGQALGTETGLAASAQAIQAK
jgi:hypothetical protein